MRGDYFMKTKIKVWAKSVVFSIAILYLCITPALYLTQRQAIYPANKQVITPAQLGVKDVDIVHAATADGLKLVGWYRAPATPDKPVIVMFHGNADHHAYIYAFLLAPYIEAGYGVLSTEYRGYGGNAGSPTEQGLYADGRAWMGWLAAQGMKPENTVLMAHSLGTGVAVQMAVEYPAVKALVLLAPYTTLPDVARVRYFFLPLDLLMKDQFRNVDKIAGIKMPLMVLNGLDDWIIPPRIGVRLYDAAPQPKSLVQLEGVQHMLPADAVAARVTHFLAGLK